ncbi:3-hydroxybenzoate 4-monooxygenase, partial [Pandoraea pneumonica]
PVTLAADGNAVHLGHHAKADGRWRLYAFADRDGLADDSPLARFAAWLLQDPGSPVRRHTPTDADIDAVFDAKVIYQQGFDAIDVTRAPAIFRPRSG